MLHYDSRTPAMPHARAKCWARCALQPCTTETGVTALAREDEARRRAMREQSALGVGDAAFGRADTTAAVEHIALGPDLACLQRDGSDKRNLELEGRAADAFFEHRLDRQAHAAIEKCRREAAMHRARWIEMSARWIQRDDDATAFGLHHIIPQGLCDCVEGQHSAGKALDELQPAHRLLSLGTDRSVDPGGHDLPSVLDVRFRAAHSAASPKTICQPFRVSLYSRTCLMRPPATTKTKQ